MSGEIRDVIILAGGFGTRLKAITGNVPKPLVPIGTNGVFLDYILSWLAFHEIEQVILSLHYEAEAFIRRYEQHQLPFALNFVVEPEPLGTGGAVNYAIATSGIGDYFCVLNGDTYLRFDLGVMFRRYFESNCTAMIGLSKVGDTGRYGAVCTEGDRVRTFQEKSQEGSGGWINNGSYILPKSLFAGRSGAFSLERDLFPQLVDEGGLWAHETDGPFIDIGVPEDFRKFSLQYGTEAIGRGQGGTCIS